MGVVFLCLRLFRVFLGRFSNGVVALSDELLKLVALGRNTRRVLAGEGHRYPALVAVRRHSSGANLIRDFTIWRGDEEDPVNALAYGGPGDQELVIHLRVLRRLQRDWGECPPSIILVVATQ
jgi:hypothetical protein